MYKGRRVHVGIVAYNEEKSIARVVRGFKMQKYIDKVIAVDNNSTDRTAKLAKKAGAAVVGEKNQGYGYACRRALREAAKAADIVVLCEGDGSFEARDIEKLLAYIEDADMVVGTRTTRELVGRGAKMDSFLLWGNIFVAKLLQMRFWGRVRLTDVGCTFRAIRKDALKRIDKQLGAIEFDGYGSYFSPVMIREALKSRLKVIEVPVNYMERIGDSKITSTRWRSFKLGLRMTREAFG